MSDAQEREPRRSHHTTLLMLNQLIWSGTTAALFVPLGRVMDSHDAAAIVAAYAIYSIVLLLLRNYWQEPYIAGVFPPAPYRPVMVASAILAPGIFGYLSLMLPTVAALLVGLGVGAAILQDVLRYRLLDVAPGLACVVDGIWLTAGAIAWLVVLVSEGSYFVPLVGWSFGALVSTAAAALLVHRMSGGVYGNSASMQDELAPSVSAVRKAGLGESISIIAMSQAVSLSLALGLAPAASTELRIVNSVLGPINSSVQGLSVGILGGRIAGSRRRLSAFVSVSCVAVGIGSLLLPDVVFEMAFGSGGSALKVPLGVLAFQRAAGGPARLAIADLKRQGRAREILRGRALSILLLYAALVPVAVSVGTSSAIAVCMLAASVVLWAMVSRTVPR